MRTVFSIKNEEGSSSFYANEEDCINAWNKLRNCRGVIPDNAELSIKRGGYYDIPKVLTGRQDRRNKGICSDNCQQLCCWHNTIKVGDLVVLQDEKYEKISEINFDWKSKLLKRLLNLKLNGCTESYNKKVTFFFSVEAEVK